MDNLHGIGSQGFGSLSADDIAQIIASHSPSGSGSSIQKSEKERVEELITMLPKSWLDPIIAMSLWQNIDLNLGIASVTNESRQKAVGFDQSAIVLACLAAWGKSLAAQSEALKDDIQKDEKDPMKLALKRFIKYGGDTQGINAIEMLQTIRSSPILVTGLQATEKDLILQAWNIAESQIILNILDKWVEIAAKLAEQQQKDIKNEFILGLKDHLNLLQNYLQDVRSGRQELSKAVVSIIMTGLSQGTQYQVPVVFDPKTKTLIVDTSRDSLVPINQNVVGSSINLFTENLPQEIQNKLNLTLSQLLANTQMTACYFNIPAALSLATMSLDATNPLQASSKTYALTITAFIMRKEFTDFVKFAILRNVPLEKITPEHLEQFVATLKIMLLTNALAALDKAQMQSSVIRGADIKSLIDGTTEPKLAQDDLRVTLAKDINTLLKILPKGGENLKEQLVSYFDINPPLEVLLDPACAFIALSDPSVFREVSLSQRG